MEIILTQYDKEVPPSVNYVQKSMYYKIYIKS